MTLTALFVKAPEGPYPPIALSVAVTPTSSASRDFIEWLNEAGVAFDEDTETAYISPEAMTGIFARLDDRLLTDPTFADGYAYMLRDLVTEVDAFEEPLATYITACA